MSTPQSWHRDLCCGHGELRVAVGPPDVLGILEVIFRIEIFNFAGDLAIVCARVERLIRSMPLTPFL